MQKYYFEFLYYIYVWPFEGVPLVVVQGCGQLVRLQLWDYEEREYLTSSNRNLKATERSFNQNSVTPDSNYTT